MPSSFVREIYLELRVALKALFPFNIEFNVEEKKMKDVTQKVNSVYQSTSHVAKNIYRHPLCISRCTQC